MCQCHLCTANDSHVFRPEYLLFCLLIRESYAARIHVSVVIILGLNLDAIWKGSGSADIDVNLTHLSVNPKLAYHNTLQTRFYP